MMGRSIPTGCWCTRLSGKGAETPGESNRVSANKKIAEGLNPLLFILQLITVF